MHMGNMIAKGYDVTKLMDNAGLSNRRTSHDDERRLLPHVLC